MILKQAFKKLKILTDKAENWQKVICGHIKYGWKVRLSKRQKKAKNMIKIKRSSIVFRSFINIID